ncbi:MAG: hypothetical protein ACKO1H_15475, partial [Tabrizicola sp.]
MIGVVLAGLGLVYAACHAVRLRLAWQHRDGAGASPVSVTVLTPILSGDPALEATLAHGPDHAPGARFVWLVDDDDPEGQRVAYGLAKGRAGVQVVVGRPPQDGENPKTLKLIRGEAFVDTDVLAVL